MMGGYSKEKLAPYGGREEPTANTYRFSVEIEVTSGKDVQEAYEDGVSEPEKPEDYIQSEIQSWLEGLNYVKSVKVERKW